MRCRVSGVSSFDHRSTARQQPTAREHATASKQKHCQGTNYTAPSVEMPCLCCNTQPPRGQRHKVDKHRRQQAPGASTQNTKRPALLPKNNKHPKQQAPGASTQNNGARAAALLQHARQFNAGACPVTRWPQLPQLWQQRRTRQQRASSCTVATKQSLTPQARQWPLPCDM